MHDASTPNTKETHTQDTHLAVLEVLIQCTLQW